MRLAMAYGNVFTQPSRHRIAMPNQSIPQDLLSLIGVAEELNGALLVYRDDEVAFANPIARQIHPYLDWSGPITFDDIFHESMKRQRISDPAIMANPEGHLAFAKAARACGQNFSFRRQYDTDTFDRFHVGLDRTWNAQVWVRVPKAFSDNLAVAPSLVPLEIAQALEQRRAIQQMTSLLEHLGVAMALVTSDCQLVNCSALMVRQLGGPEGFPLSCDDAGKMLTADAKATVKFRRAVWSVCRRRTPAALIPVGEQQIAVLAAHEADQAIVVVKATADPNAFRQVLESAYGLTDREAEVVVLLASGSVAEEIAAMLGRKIDTVRRQITTAKAKIAADRQHSLAHIITRAAALFGGIPQNPA